MFHVTRVLITAHVVTQILSPNFLVDLSIKVAGRTFHPCRCLATKAPKRPGFQDFSGYSLKVRFFFYHVKRFPKSSDGWQVQSFGTTIDYIYPKKLPQKISQSGVSLVGKQAVDEISAALTSRAGQEFRILCQPGSLKHRQEATDEPTISGLQKRHRDSLNFFFGAVKVSASATNCGTFLRNCEVVGATN